MVEIPVLAPPTRSIKTVSGAAMSATMMNLSDVVGYCRVHCSLESVRCRTASVHLFERWPAGHASVGVLWLYPSQSTRSLSALPLLQVSYGWGRLHLRRRHRLGPRRLPGRHRPATPQATYGLVDAVFPGLLVRPRRIS